MFMLFRRAVRKKRVQGKKEKQKPKHFDSMLRFPSQAVDLFSRNFLTSKITTLVLCVFFLLDAILNMVNNIAANVLGGKPEGGADAGGILITSFFTFHVHNFLFLNDHFDDFSGKSSPVILMWKRQKSDTNMMTANMTAVSKAQFFFVSSCLFKKTSCKACI